MVTVDSYTWNKCDIEETLNEKDKFIFKIDTPNINPTPIIHMLNLNPDPNFKTFNNLTIFPENLFYDYPEIEELNVNRCGVEIFKISRDIPINKIDILGIRQNEIESLDEFTFSQLTELRILTAMQNKIRTITKRTFEKNVKLQLLNLGVNNIDTFHKDAFKNLKDMHTLFLDVNKIKILPTKFLEHNINLERIHLYLNQIEFIHKNLFKNCKKLMFVNLRNNNIKQFSFDLDEFFAKMPLAKEFDIRANNWNCPFLIELITEFKKREIAYFHDETLLNATKYEGVNCVKVLRAIML